ncbi:guanylate kinase [Candidatus Desulfovibrio trichonymphae]|uniref:Guanylate kinase n=1 Tax=Candidatus Desulfovibrio trichonymphae TaxID=1725232 RepID=A0A1J1E2S4_9BACT|nr:guanylate kinase [Candidatus Desulfovibrio trichonymphae]BAV92179.1 guanylate kinase [Candidatus Desulfovibrio trichonymphae]GHU92590.1 guanylate kinase [Deltaproteobacteria bacterium]GHU96484.1 guanylate kinase [Deltaproteobacteria bacterium]GHU98897.1 guanylate kinase [Deltaproteobacteria bacterium]
MQREGIALVVSAPSGAGKTTLISRLISEFPHFAFSVSCTTREPRRGETDGQNYIFLSRDEFERRRSESYFAEWAEVYGNLYGTPLVPVRQLLRKGQDVIFDIDVQGAAQLKLSLPTAVFVFILPPDMENLERRLRGRGQDDETTIARRLATARKEISEARWYDALVVNDDLDHAYDALRTVYLASALAPVRNPLVVEALLAR